MKTKQIVTLTIIGLALSAACVYAADKCWRTYNNAKCASTGNVCLTGTNCKMTADVNCDRDRIQDADEGGASGSNTGCKGPAVWDDAQGNSHSGTAKATAGGDCYTTSGTCPAPA